MWDPASRRRLEERTIPRVDALATSSSGEVAIAVMGGQIERRDAALEVQASFSVLPEGEIDYTVRLRRPDGTSFGIQRADLVDCTVTGLTVQDEPGSDDQ